MGEVRSSISRIPDLLDQLDWLTDELEAQRPFLARMPDVQIKTSPLPELPSLLGMYYAMVARERDIHLPSLGIKASSHLQDVPASDAWLDDLIIQLISMRSAIVDHLGRFTDDDWRAAPAGASDHADVVTLAFEITQTDADSLRAIAERMREGQTALG